VTYGRLYNNLVKAHEILGGEGISFDILKLIEIFPISDSAVEIMKNYDKVIFFEECYKYGSIGEKYSALTGNCECVAIDGFVRHGEPSVLLDELGLSAEKMAEKIKRCFAYD
jgi:1-deoxy-D-xylulose-5-phosphate synthase